MKWNQGGQFENPPAGMHVARCIKLIDLGTQPVTFNNETKYQRKVLICWELPETRMAGLYKPEVKGLPFAISRRYTQSLASNSNLKKDLEGWRGKQFDAASATAFQPKDILGKPCMLNLVEQGEFVNVAGITPVPKNLKCPKQINPSVYFSLAPEEFDNKVLQSLPEKTREKITTSPEFKSLMTGAPEQEPTNEDPPVDTDNEEQPF